LSSVYLYEDYVLGAVNKGRPQRGG